MGLAPAGITYTRVRTLRFDCLVEVVADPVGREDEKDLELLAVTFLDSPVRDPDIVRLELCLASVDVGH